MSKIFKKLAYLGFLSLAVVFSACDPIVIGGEPDNGDTGGNTGGGGGNPPAETVTLSGYLYENKTLPDLGLSVDYYIDGSYYVYDNALLTVEPGVTIVMMTENSRIYVDENAALKMVGTVDKPIMLRGPLNNTSVGSWDNVYINSTRNDNQFEYVTFLNGGKGGAWNNAIVLNEGKISMKNCVIDGAAGDGIYLYGGTFSAFENNTIKNVTKYPVVASRLDRINNWASNNTYIQNGNNYIMIEGGYSYHDQDFTVSNQGIPYYMTDGLDFSSEQSVQITFTPSTVMLFAAEKGFYIDENIKIVAQGLPTNPIIFRGFHQEVGFWAGVRQYSERQGNIFDYCTFSDGGCNSGWTTNFCMYLSYESKTTITNCTFADSDFYGVVLANPGNANFRLTSSNNTFLNCRVGNVYNDYEGTVHDSLDGFNQ